MSNNLHTDPIYTKAIKKFGAEAQLNKLKEELFELGQAVCHFQLGKIGVEDLCDEMADVMTLINQFYSLSPEYQLLISQSLSYKKHRLRKLLEDPTHA